MTVQNTQDSRGRKNEVIGKVVSDKMNKTIKVESRRSVKHGKYGKFIRKSSVFKVHDEENVAKVGDMVRIVESRPLSKTKRWKLVEVVEKNKAEGTESV